MTRGSHLLLDLLQTATRLLPWPTRPGVRAIGSPGPESPVLVTGNYDLTVRRLSRAIDGLDAWLVVAPSSGINVWCAAAGGHLGTHQVVTALKTSGIEERVRHRRAVLPQLAASGVEPRAVARRCGWRVRFGPVYARDLPRYLSRGGKKTPDMRTVRFGLLERLEMAASWGIPAALVVGGIGLAARPPWAVPLAILAAALSAAVFLGYDRLPEPRRVWFGAAALLAAVLAARVGGGSLGTLAWTAAATVALTGLLTFDYSGSTPVEGGSHFEERELQITLDTDRCRGVLSCLRVCPEGVFEPEPAAGRVSIARLEDCIRCGACVVQCPMDALLFQGGDGERILPATVRQFKLDLRGRRGVRV